MASALLVAGASCKQTATPAECEPDRVYCEGPIARRCIDGFRYEDTDCSRMVGQICSEGLGCRSCHPQSLLCDGQSVVRCGLDGETKELVTECDVANREVCYLGNCIDACAAAEQDRSYVGCEYWGVDLDNAVISSLFNAAAQQYAVVVSNVSAVDATVVVEVNDAPPGWPLQLREVARVGVPVEGLEVINLPAREVDGSPPGEWNVGTHTAYTSNAFRITSNVPIIAYQFSPLDNAQVFSNDASLLIPKSALDNRYFVMSWPQTIAETNDFDTNFDEHLRAFLTIVGTETGTDVTITLSTDIVGGGTIPATRAKETLQLSLGPFDVINLETGSWGADFTGTIIESDKPIAVFSGSEASDVPAWRTLSTRLCCADHLQHQLFGVTSLGTSFVIARMPSRTAALAAAAPDENITVLEESDYVRILATEDQTEVTTSLPPPLHRFEMAEGEHVTFEARCDFTMNANRPIVVAQFVAGQGATGIDVDLPGGDPSYILVPPVEQWRSNYVFLTPDKYAFDFVVMVSPNDNPVSFDYLPLGSNCVSNRAQCPDDPEVRTNMQVHRCQLGFPIIIPGLPPPDNIDHNIQDDGYHVAGAQRPFGLTVYGFDKHVSYGYAGGTDLKRINID